MLTRRTGRRLEAYFTMVGTVIGAGIFGVPFVYSRAGTLLGVVLTLALGAALALQLAFYTETLLRTEEASRLPGLARRYLGPRWGGLAAVSSLIGFWTALLAYFLLGGTFLSTLFGGVGLTPLGWSVVFYAACSAVVAGGLYAVGRAELWLTAGLLAVVTFLLLRLAPQVSAANWSSADPGRALLPYGVLLFALAGSSAVPSMRSLLRGDERALPRAVLWGSATAAFVTLLFGLIVSGVSGVATSEDAIAGLVPLLGGGIIAFGALFGLLAVSTSFFSGGLYLRDVFRVDYRLSRRAASALALAPPLILYALGGRNFILVIGFAGAVFGAIDTAVICLSWRAAKRAGERRPEFSVPAPRWVAGLLIGIFVLGLLATVLRIRS